MNISNNATAKNFNPTVLRDEAIAKLDAATTADDATTIYLDAILDPDGPLGSVNGRADRILRAARNEITGRFAERLNEFAASRLG